MFELTPWNARVGNVFNNLRQEMDFLWDRLGANGPAEDGGTAVTAFAPRMNFAETDKQYEVSLDLPGVKAEDCNVEFRDGHLWISAQRKDETEEKGKTWHRVERRFGEFRRVVAMPGDVEADKVQANYKEGVLTVVIPKAPAALPKKISVTSK